jgi:glyoxylase-like metal-dependent hydrolase (beta-lactamase superfamily II)
MILESLVVSLFQENCYIFGDEQESTGVIVDPGDEAARIALTVEQTGLEIEKILLTHAHIDHVGAVADLQQEYGCPTYIHREAEPMLQQLPTQAMMMGVRFGKVPAVDGYIEAGDRIKVGNLELEALYTPGHAPGHLSLYCASEGLVISGDALFAGSIGRTDLPGGDSQTLLASIREQLLTLPDETVVYPGHGPATTIGEEKQSNPFLQGTGGMAF